MQVSAIRSMLRPPSCVAAALIACGVAGMTPEAQARAVDIMPERENCAVSPSYLTGYGLTVIGEPVVGDVLIYNRRHGILYPTDTHQFDRPSTLSGMPRIGGDSPDPDPFLADPAKDTVLGGKRVVDPADGLPLLFSGLSGVAERRGTEPGAAGAGPDTEGGALKETLLGGTAGGDADVLAAPDAGDILSAITDDLTGRLATDMVASLSAAVAATPLGAGAGQPPYEATAAPLEIAEPGTLAILGVALLSLSVVGRYSARTGRRTSRNSGTGRRFSGRNRLEPRAMSGTGPVIEFGEAAKRIRFPARR